MMEFFSTISGQTSKAAEKAGTGDSIQDGVKNILSGVFVLAGIVAVIMIIIGAVRYTTSQGDPGRVKKGKDTILYGVIGLVIAILAFAIVNFVLTTLGANSGTEGGEG